MSTNYLSSSILTSVSGGHINSSGNASVGKKTVTKVKSFRLNERVPYVSAQSIRKLCRNLLELLLREPNYYNRVLKKVKAQGEGQFCINPVSYIEDDMFGYSGPYTKNPNKNADSARMQTAAVNRHTPFVVSGLYGILGLTSIHECEGWIHLLTGTNLPYNSEFSVGYFRSSFNLELNRIGVFNNFGDQFELEPEFIKSALSTSKLVEDSSKSTFVVKNLDARRKNVAKLYRELILNLNGGAKEAGFACSLLPKIVIIAGLKSSFPLPSDIYIKNNLGNVCIDFDKIENFIEKFGDNFSTSLYIGYRSGTFVTNEEGKLKKRNGLKISYAGGSVRMVITTPRKALDSVIEHIDFSSVGIGGIAT